MSEIPQADYPMTKKDWEEVAKDWNSTPGPDRNSEGVPIADYDMTKKDWEEVAEDRNSTTGSERISDGSEQESPPRQRKINILAREAVASLLRRR